MYLNFDRPVTYQEVLRQLKTLRLECLTRHDQIRAKFVKLVADYIVSPLTHINECMAINSFSENMESCKSFTNP